ncbi:DNA modification methylase [Lactococcus lactis]|uniref:DNA modification methylase n=1 Tax=Lactococcus lactis TaxID=1358 RepID=UPI00223AA0D5|nr:DNA modification methylase [Lactococcus lactis]MCT1183071.1 DNA modification methylase [Lactococcus lactis]
METIIKKVSELIPYINNPRNNDEAVDAVASSIKNFGFKVPIVVDSNNEIINGHTRLKAAQKLGLETVPVIVADDLTPEQVKAFRLADNKVGEIATWNDEMLAIELGELAEIDFDMTEFGFEIEEEKEVIEDEDFDTTPPEEPTSKLGDIYQLGRHRLMVGDSTDCEQVKALMGEQQADLLLTDPPYNVAYQGKTEDSLTIQNDSKSAADFHLFLVDVFEAAKSVMKKGASFYCWYASSEVVNFHTSIEETGFMVKQELIWNKNSMVLGRQDYQWKHEPCLYGWLEGASHSWYSARNQTTVLNFDKPQRNGDHPTMKPVALFDYQMQNSSKQGDIVLDLFGGSGTTMIAVEQNGRNAYLMEFDPRYADVIIRRWEELTGEKAVKIN